MNRSPFARRLLAALTVGGLTLSAHAALVGDKPF